MNVVNSLTLTLWSKNTNTNSNLYINPISLGLHGIKQNFHIRQDLELFMYIHNLFIARQNIFSLMKSFICNKYLWCQTLQEFHLDLCDMKLRKWNTTIWPITSQH